METLDVVEYFFWAMTAATAILPFIAAWTSAEMSPAPYTVRLFSIMVVMFAIPALAIYTHVAVVVLLIIPYFLIYRWSAMRLNAVGLSKWWLLVSIVNFLGLMYAFKLCTMPDHSYRPSYGQS